MAKAKGERSAPVSATAVATMMSGLLRRAKAMRSARPRLKDQHFYDDEEQWGLLWQIACDWWDEYGKLPGRKELFTQFAQAIDENPALLDRDQVKRTKKFIANTFNMPLDDLTSPGTLSILKKFLVERISGLLKDELDKPTISSNWGGMVDVYRAEVRDAEAMQQGGSRRPFDNGWAPKSINKITTGCGFLDHFLNGGHARQEANVLIAGYGSCKTTLAVQLTWEAALQFWKDYQKQGKAGRLKMAYMFFYEGTMDEILCRFLTYVARIHKDTWEDYKTIDDLSHRGKLKEYEEEMYEVALKAGQKVDGERERMDKAMKLINRNVRLIDCTGHDPDYPQRGAGVNGMAHEIAEILRNDASFLGKNKKPGIVILDHVSAMAERHISDGPGKVDQLRHYIGRFPINFANQVCIPFDVPGWAFHQTSTSAQSRPPGYIPHHTDAAEARNFGENAHFSFNVGTTDGNNMAVMSCTKHRRRPPEPYQVIKIDGAFGRVLSTDGRYVVDPSTNRIVEAGDLRKIARPTRDSGHRPKPSKVGSGDSTRTDN